MNAPAHPSTALDEHVREFLAAPRYATISTLNPDGSPHQAVIWYLLDGDRLIINSRRERRWPQNLLRDPRLHVAIHDHDDLFHWVGVTGRAQLLREGNAAYDDIASLARRYSSDPEKYRGQDRLTFAVRIDRSYEYGD